ncbi:hypothetical protein Cni_G14015 [Canna indica]|uniref:RING-type E3 ubiquitin transferase n=1 Tax=Canna indica TaxID=4628 RepID=A0AAQ3KDQ0_9LILI|nr:hypothetical protein Cni_G14015 [Canna indica]
MFRSPRNVATLQGRFEMPHHLKMLAILCCRGGVKTRPQPHFAHAEGEVAVGVSRLGAEVAGDGGLVDWQNAENVAARLEMQAAHLEAHVEQMFDGLDDADGAEDVPFDELVGMQGPVFHLVENAITCTFDFLSATVVLNSIQPVLSGLPIGALLGFKLKLNELGIWSGMLIGTLAQTVILLLITFRTKWQKEIFFDNSARNIEAGKAVGFYTVLIHNNSTYFDELVAQHVKLDGVVTLVDYGSLSFLSGDSKATLAAMVEDDDPPPPDDSSPS